MEKIFFDKDSAIHRILAILEKVASSDRPVSPTEINDNLNLPKATIHRLFTTLEDELFLQREIDGKRFLPGSRMRKMALGVLCNEHFRTERHAILMRLSGDVEETCNISIPDRSQMRYLDRTESHWPLRMQFPIWTKVPMHCTSGGKLFLSLLPKGQLSSLIGNLNLKQRNCEHFYLEKNTRESFGKNRERTSLEQIIRNLLKA